MSSTTPVQASLNRFSDCFIIRRADTGGHRSIIDALPEDTEENNTTVREKDSEIGRTDVDYPVERDHCTVSLYTEYYQSSRHTSGGGYTHKRFDIDIDREVHPEEADRIESLLSTVRELPDLEAEIKTFDTYEELRENAETVRRYDAIYNLVMRISAKNSLASYVERGLNPTEFSIEYHSQGFYRIPMLHHSTVNNILSDTVEERDLGTYTLAWGGFNVDPEHFEAIHDLFEPFFKTATGENSI